ncbi:acetyl-CoA synthetase-like protein [Choiromyces venosus 120613-1]|uniref:Acetyl-CoA synthetase-like protein n=1 Tax=Choiromyces venosus 120613-1 TaxID=1336337 RepID=A0A3N4JIA4_9PEZI|nr:acetyl-CoA synthetase-like protein [Choiromyces venosus 120613-1]
MPQFASTSPPIDLPTKTLIWSWLFQNPTSKLSICSPSSVGSFIDASSGTSFTHNTLRDNSTYLSTALCKAYNLQPNDTVSLFSTNTIYYPAAMFAALRVGAVVSGASPAYGVDEMTYALKTANAKFLFTLPGSIAIAAEAAGRVGIPKGRIFLLEGSVAGFNNVQELVEVGRGYGDAGQVGVFQVPQGKTNGEVVGFLSFSSGTTGLPKAVMISHQNVIAQCLQIAQLTTPDLDRVLAALPFFHITGLVHLLHLPLVVNASVVVMPTFTVQAMLEATVKYKLIELLVVPPILIRLVRDPIVDKYDLSHVRRFSTGAAPLSLEIIKELAKKFPQAGLKQGYGMTESTSCITATFQDSYSWKWAHSVGRVCPSTVIKIVDENGNELGIDQPGEVLAKGPQCAMGYLNNAKATAETIDKDGWLHTGDIGTIDAYGMVRISDRTKELIKVNGVAVAPAELEDLLLGHPAIEDCAVLGVPHDTMGEVPRAYVMLKQVYRNKDAKAVEGEIVEFVKRSKGAKLKWLRGGVRFLDTIPKSPTGKILRRVLRDGMDKEEGEKVKAKL